MGQFLKEMISGVAVILTGSTSIIKRYSKQEANQ